MFVRAPEPVVKQRRRFWPILVSAVLVGSLGALVVYQMGLGGEAPVPVSQSAASTPAPTPAPTPAAEAAPVEQPKPTPLPAEQVQAPATETVPDAEPAFANAKQPERVVRVSAQSIWVTTNPPGAKAVLDGNLEQACQTPCMLHGTMGVHHLAVSQAGYLNEYRDVRVGDEAVDVPQIALRQPMGTLMLSSDPAGASILVNGQLVTQVTPAVLSLKPGSYSVSVEKNGVSKTERVDLGDNLVHLSVTLVH